MWLSGFPYGGFFCSLKKTHPHPPVGTILKMQVLISQQTFAGQWIQSGTYEEIGSWVSVPEEIILNTWMAHGHYFACQTPLMDCSYQGPFAEDSEAESRLNGNARCQLACLPRALGRKSLAQCLAVSVCSTDIASFTSDWGLKPSYWPEHQSTTSPHAA